MNEKNWTSHLEFVVIFITLVGGFYTLDSKIEVQAQNIITLNQAQTQRTDRLYEMYCETQKEIKEIYQSRFN